MASATEIANLAAGRIGSETRITSLDEDRPIARAIKSVWDTERRATIRDGAFNFAMARDELAAEVLAGGVPYPWTYSFPLPADCLRLVEVLNTASRVEYQLEGRSILADEAGPLYIRYCRDVTEPALWDALFAEAFACRIAWKIGNRIAGSAYDQVLGWQEYRAAISATRAVDALENPPIAFEESSWIEARQGGSWWR